MRRFMIVGQALAMCLAQLTLCQAASFNCQPYLARRACPELAICSDPGLSRLDDSMASLYFDARSRMPASMTTGFRDYQREWLAKRGACGCDVSCLESAYRSQIDGLRKTINQMNQ